MTKLLNSNEAAALFNIELSTLYSWVHKKKIPYVKLGHRRGRTKFVEEQLIELINSKIFNPNN